MLVLHRQAMRMGVSHADLPEESTALADETEWFDPRTSRWHLRVPDSDQVIISDPVRRMNRDGRPLEANVFMGLKTAALAALKGEGKPQAGKGNE